MSGNFIVDSHCHLNYDILSNNLDEVLQRAEENKVKLMVSICTKMSEFEDIQELIEPYKQIFMSVGIHPNESANEPDITVDDIYLKTKLKKVVAIGETGLDYYHKKSEKNIQKTSFLKHIEASQMSQLPLVIHSREADKDMIDILTVEMKNKAFPALLHCFSSSRELAMRAVDLGVYISLSGIITFKNSSDLCSTVKDIPTNQLLVETDSPYLAPVPHRGQSNEPSYTLHVVEKLASILQIEIEEAMKLTTKNFFRLFSKVQKKLIKQA